MKEKSHEEQSREIADIKEQLRKARPDISDKDLSGIAGAYWVYEGLEKDLRLALGASVDKFERLRQSHGISARDFERGSFLALSDVAEILETLLDASPEEPKEIHKIRQDRRKRTERTIAAVFLNRALGISPAPKP